jgi:hypothetical protein
VFRNVRDCTAAEFEEPVPGTVYFGGLDLARTEDYTVLVIVDRDARVVCVDRFTRLDWAIQVNRVRATAKRYNNARLLVDSTGSGEPVFENLRRAGCYVEGYPFTAKSKSDLVTNLSLMLENRRLVLPKPELWPEGIEELEAFEYTATDSGGVRMEAPYGMHDDCVIALALAAWKVRTPYVPPQIHTFRSVDEMRRFLRRFH